ncbi:prepilin-type N-terminal cleavage/methylation domain-containing protein [Pseudomonas stutzeri]|nr:prepilin-type N-terminal cleavage/methylation domain-containing protein [Stutzerimonas stutzeri]
MKGCQIGGRRTGFTLVELILVIVVLGILAAVVGPRFFDRRVFDERLHYEESLAALRYAQKRAIAGGCPVRVQVAPAAYSVSLAAACGGAAAGTPLVDPSGGRFPAPLASADLDLTFGALGQPLSGSPTSHCGRTGQAAGVVIGSHCIGVEAETGYVR